MDPYDAALAIPDPQQRKQAVIDFCNLQGVRAKIDELNWFTIIYKPRIFKRRFNRIINQRIEELRGML